METVSVRYIVNDVDAAMEFSTGPLGFEVQMRPAAGFAMLSRGGLRLLLNAPGAGGGGRASATATPSPRGWNRFQLIVGDLDATVARLEAADVRLRTPIVEGNGGRQVLVEDPSGNPIEVFEPTA